MISVTEFLTLALNGTYRMRVVALCQTPELNPGVVEGRELASGTSHKLDQIINLSNEYLRNTPEALSIIVSVMSGDSGFERNAVIITREGLSFC